jgi:photosystem II stability/assembly factor-like uncharacterized protein
MVLATIAVSVVTPGKGRERFTNTISASDRSNQSVMPEGHWIRTGGTVTGPVYDVVLDPTLPRMVYAGSPDGVAKSIDGGQTWNQANQGLTSTDVRDIAIDPTDTRILYAGVLTGLTRGVFRSADRGRSWAPRDSGLGNRDVNVLEVDASNHLVLYAGTTTTIFKSTNAGQSWSQSGFGLPTDVDIEAVAVDPLDGQVLYAGTEDASQGGDGVYKSEDGGASWFPSSTPELADLGVLALLIDPAAPDTVYAGTKDWAGNGDGGVFKTTDGGSTWIRLTRGSAVRALGLSPTNPDIIYAVGDDGASRSSDGGTSWKAVNQGLANDALQSVAIHPSSPAVAFVSGPGVFKTTRGGVRWVDSLAQAFSENVRALAVAPSERTIMYAGTADEAVFRSTDAGASWIETGQLGNGSGVVEWLAVDPSDSATAYAGMHSSAHSLYKTTDAGSTWTAAEDGLVGDRVNALVVDPMDPRVIYAGHNGNPSLSVSTNGGLSWEASSNGIPSPTAVGSLVIDASQSGATYAGVSGGAWADGVYKSTDGGASWERDVEGMVDSDADNADALVANPDAPTTLFAALGCPDDDECGFSKVYRSTDGALSWQLVLEEPSLRFTSLAVRPTDQVEVFAGHLSLGVFLSIDGGETWQTINEGLDTTAVNALVVSPTAPYTVYAGTNLGVFAFDE